MCKYNAERDRLHTTYNKRLSGRGAEVLERKERKKRRDGYKERKQNRIDENEMIEKSSGRASKHEKKKNGNATEKTKDKPGRTNRRRRAPQNITKHLPRIRILGARL